MLLNKLISVIALAVLVFAESDSDIPHVRSKRTIGVVLKNVGDLFGFDVFRRPAASSAVPAAAGTSSDNVGKSFTIAINWNKNRTHANRPAAAPAAAAAPAPAPAAAARPPPAAPAAGPAPAAAPASGPAPAAAPASGPAPAAAPAAGAAPSATPASGPAPAATPASDASPAAAPAPTSADAPAPTPDAAPASGAAPANAPAPAPAEAAAPAAPRRPSGPPTKAQLYVEYVDDNGNAREAQEKEEEEEDDDDEDRPKRIQIGLPDYSSVDYNEVKRDLANQGNNDIDHSREKFKQEFNNFWEASPWTLEHGYKFIVPQGPDAIIDDITKGVSRYQEFDLPKKNNARSLKIVHNVKVYHQPAKTETYNDVENQKFYTAANPQRQHELHILDEEGVRYIVHQNGKKIPIPSNINAQLLEFFKKKFQADAAAQRKAAVEGQQNAIQSNTQQTTPAPIDYTKAQAPVIYVPPEIIKQHIDNINKEISKPITHPNEQPEIKEERHVLKVNHYRSDETPQTNYGDQPETVREPEYLDIKEKVEAGPPKNYISVSPHENLNSYIANARPGQIVKIKIVEPSQGADIDIKRDGYGDSDDVRKNVQREKEKVTERHEKTETEHYKKTEEPRVEKIEHYPGFNYKEYEKVGYPNYDDTKDKDFFRGFSEEQKKNIEDHYNFFSSARDPRGRDKEQLNTKTSDKYDKEKSDEETKTKVNVEDDDKKGRDSYSSQRGNVGRKDERKEDTEEDEEERPQNIKYESATKKEEDEDDEDERPHAKNVNVSEDDENENENKRRSHHEEINKEEEGDEDDEVERRPKLVEKENVNKEEEDEDVETEDRSLVKKENINEEEDDDDDEVEEQPRSTERENITEEEDDEDDEVEERPKSVEKENITEEEDDEDDEVEDRPKLVERENITYEDDDDDDEVEDRPKSTERENITEEEEEDEEIENDDEESKQRPKIINTDEKEKFEVENFYDSNPKEFNSERQQQASNQNKDNFISELDSFISTHFKDKNYLNEIEDGSEKKETRDGNEHEKEYDDVFSKLREGTEYEDFYKQFHGDAKFTPSKQNLIDSETKTVRSKEKQQPDSTVVQPLYSGVLHAPAVQELFKSNKPLTVPFEHDYSASETKSRSAKPRTKRSIEFSNEEDEDEDESQYVPDRYTVEDNYETPEPKMPDFAKLEAKQYKDDDTLSPKARVSKVEDGQKTTWINVKVPVTYITDVRT